MVGGALGLLIPPGSVSLVLHYLGLMRTLFFLPFFFIILSTLSRSLKKKSPPDLLCFLHMFCIGLRCNRWWVLLAISHSCT
ncbi:hypothetical protein BDY21DRAFT_342184 [Lineolata rhizophorae]|uniref:Uncharacterized protein n=1 Tax=Lineolata rhizophorae TaxID=578093 RepID=A0A6A6P361_9PEZI|nr:hypothetical protein BDY21DRAFT_342184 [Lineolata rhizophorae]